MGRFKNYDGMLVMHAVEGLNGAGETVRVERVERPLASTLGFVWVRVLVNGEGVSSEQFSRTRLARADKAFSVAAKKLTVTTVEGTPPPAKPVRTAKPAPETLLLDEGGVSVVMVTGSKPRFEIRRAGADAEVVVATSAWRAEQKAVIARAHAYVA